MRFTLRLLEDTRTRQTCTRTEGPAPAIESLKSELGTHSGNDRITVVDLGAGTGRFTKHLIGTGVDIVAVEPVDGMRRKFASLYPEVRLLERSAENIPLPDSCVDLVVVAQAFHWFNGILALKEIHRILKPAGKLCLIWNSRKDIAEWSVELKGIMKAHIGDTPSYGSGNWRKAFEELILFSPLRESRFKFVQKSSPQMIVDSVCSRSYIASLPATQLENVKSQVWDLIKKYDMASETGLVDVPHRTDVFWCSKL